MVKVTKDYPIIPLRDVVVFPGIVTALFVGRSKSIEALNDRYCQCPAILGTFFFSYASCSTLYTGWWVGHNFKIALL